MDNEYWYRFEDKLRSTGSVTESGDYVHNSRYVEVLLHKYIVVKHTPKGVWLREIFGPFEGTNKRFVLNNAKKRFACPSIEAAKTSFRARKQRQADIYRLRLQQAEEAIQKVSTNSYIPRFLYKNLENAIFADQMLDLLN